MPYGYHSFLVFMVSFVYKSKVMMFDSRLSLPVDLCYFHEILYIVALDYTLNATLPFAPFACPCSVYQFAELCYPFPSLIKLASPFGVYNHWL